MRHSHATLAKPSNHENIITQPGGPAGFTVARDWTAVLTPGNRMPLETVLVQWMRGQRWFGGKAKTVTHVKLKASIPIPFGPEVARFNLVEVSYLHGEPELYSLPLAFAEGARAAALRRDAPRQIICDLAVEASGKSGVIHDAAASKEFCRSLAGVISAGRLIQSPGGVLLGWHTPVLGGVLGDDPLPEAIPAKAEQSNSSIIYGDKFILKLLRHPYVGINPDLELTEFLTQRKFPGSQQLAGALEFTGPDGKKMTLGMMNRFIPDARDAWAYTLAELGRYYERAAGFVVEGRSPPAVGTSSPLAREMPSGAGKLLGSYSDSARRLGERTAALHLALASKPDDAAFAPEPFTPDYVRDLRAWMRNQAATNLGLLREQLKGLPSDVVPLARRVLQSEPAIMERFRLPGERGIAASRIRIHGDYHLGQVLYADGDFVIIDFEGEPEVSPDQRRLKRSPLRDVAGMVRSFDYAAWEGLAEHVTRAGLQPDDRRKLEPWLRAWYQAASSVFLQAYFATIGDSGILPRSPEQLSTMWSAFLLNKAIYELGYELNNRPAWLAIPLHGILLLLEDAR